MRRGFKFSTPNQTLSRLPLSLAQLILKNVKTKLDTYCILCTDQKRKLHKTSTQV